MRNIDLGSWQAALSTLLGVALFALVGIGIRLLLMMTVQQRRERMNRQINERLKLLIAAYKTLGGSFTGNLLVDPRHLRDFREEGAEAPGLGWERCRQIRDAVEGALSDILLLGTEEQVRLAGRAAQDLVAGQPVRTDELVVSLRAFIRSALDMAPIPPTVPVPVPVQGPSRPSASAARGKGEAAKAGSGRGGGGGMGGGMVMGLGAGHTQDAAETDPDPADQK